MYQIQYFQIIHHARHHLHSWHSIIYIYVGLKTSILRLKDNLSPSTKSPDLVWLILCQSFGMLFPYLFS